MSSALDAAETRSEGSTLFAFDEEDRDARQSATFRMTFKTECRRGWADECLRSVAIKLGISLSSRVAISLMYGRGT